MQEEEIKLHARRYIEDEGYQQYTLTSIVKTVGTNVWTVIAEIPDGNMELLINDLDGSLMNKTKHLVKVVNETVNISESVSVAAIYDFELKEKVFIGGKFINTDTIELIQDESDPQYLKGFRISVSPLNDENSRKAYEIANRITNYLSTITGLIIEHKRPIIRQYKGQKTTNTISITVDAILAKVQDLDLSKISKFINTDTRVHQHTYQLKKGHEAFLNNDFAQAIRWFFMIIENDGSLESEKYRPLRNVVSHEELDKPSTINGVGIFGINMNKGDHLNFNDPKIQTILKQEANNLYNIVRPKVEQEIKDNL